MTDHRLGQTIPHSDSVRVDAPILSSDHTYRYRLDIEFTNATGNQIAVVILKNPSSGTEKGADTTIRRIEEFFIKNLPNVKQLKIVNLFAIRGTDAYKLKGQPYETIVGFENDKYISMACEKANLVICAWGGNSGIDKINYQKRITEVQSIIKSKPLFRVEGKRKTIQPLHAMIWGLDYSLVEIPTSN